MLGAVLAVLASGAASASPAFGAAATEASERAAERTSGQASEQAAEQAAEQECLPAWRGPETAFLPARWQQALDALIEATAHEGQPWSCPDARVTLVPPGPPQTPGRRALPQLQVEDAAGVRRHPVTSPGEIVPLGEAMLARTFTLETPAPRPAPPPVSLAPVLAAERAPWATARGP